MAGATLALPAGWAAKPTGHNPAWWCLLPASQAVPYLTGDCPIHFIQISAPPTVQLDVDIPVGLAANPQFCLPVKSDRLVDFGDKTFGGRAADYRRWELSCTTARIFQIEHYVVATRPAYVLFSQNADARIHSVMSQIAAGSTLPAATATLRYADLGYVRSLSHQADGYHITLDRVIDAPGGLINNNPATYAYVVPDVAIPADRKLAINQLARLITDGDRVTKCSGSVTPHG